MSRRIRVVYNANAGSKVGLRVHASSAEEILAVMARYDLGDDLVQTTSEEEADASAREAAGDGFDMVVAAGGDGTACTIARALLGTRTALGILPLGSVMNLARSLHIPRELDAAAEIIAAGAIRAIDVGDAAGQLFLENGSVGMNAAIFREATRIDEGEWRGALTAIWVALTYRPARMRLTLDDQVVHTRALLVNVANGPYTGIGFTVAPGARLTDGQFDVRIFRGFSRWELLRHFAAIAFGRRRYHPKIVTYRSARVQVTSVHPLPCRVDSHDLGTTPITFVVRPAALLVVAPTIHSVGATSGSAAERAVSIG